MVNAPAVNASTYFDDEDENTPAKHGTTVQSGWNAAMALLKPKKSSTDYAPDFKITEQPQLIRFLEDEPFKSYEQHWINRAEGKRSFVCLGADCPLCTIAGDKPSARFAFNVVAVTDEEPVTKILTASIPVMRLIIAAHEDPRRGPLSKYFWAIGRQGQGLQTTYSLDRVKAVDLADEWDLDIETVEEVLASATLYKDDAVYTSPREELLTLARQLVANASSN
jgi:hypothetical protein